MNLCGNKKGEKMRTDEKREKEKVKKNILINVSF